MLQCRLRDRRVDHKRQVHIDRREAWELRHFGPIGKGRQQWCEVELEGEALLRDLEALTDLGMELPHDPDPGGADAYGGYARGVERHAAGRGVRKGAEAQRSLSLIHISEPTR